MNQYLWIFVDKYCNICQEHLFFATDTNEKLSDFVLAMIFIFFQSGCLVTLQALEP